MWVSFAAEASYNSMRQGGPTGLKGPLQSGARYPSCSIPNVVDDPESLFTLILSGGEAPGVFRVGAGASG